MLLFTQTLKKGGGLQDGQREKEEIHSLQEQLAALKEITVGGAVMRLQLHHFLKWLLICIYGATQTWEIFFFLLSRWSETQFVFTYWFKTTLALYIY